MFSQVSYNIVVERFKAFADGHYLIKRFSHGQIDVTDIMKDAEYPWMHIVPVSMNPSTGSRSFSFDVLFADLPRDKSDKTEYQRESLSDCIRLAEDLLAEIQNGSVIFGEDVELESGASISPFMEEYTHVLTGVTLSLTMTFPWDWNACDIPADWSAGGSGSGGTGGGGASLVLKVNGVPNVIQTMLDLVDGTGISINDLGDGRVEFTNTGGGGGAVSWGAIVGTLTNQTDLVNALDLKSDITSLGAVAFSNDYNDLDNLPTIPSTPSLQDVTDVGNTTNNNIQFDSGVGIYFNNGSKVTEGTTNSGLGGNNGVALKCSIDYELKWEAGRLYVMEQNGFTIREVSHNFTNVPTINDDDSKGFVVGSRWILDNGDVYTCSDASTGSAVWVLSSGFTQVNSDWNAVSGVAEILNKPTLPAVIGDMLKSVYDTDDDGIVDSSEKTEIIVRNSTGVTITKGSVVYLSGATGNRPNILLADATDEITSSKTIGLVIADIPNNTDGSIAVNGTLHDLDTSSFSAGDTLWLSETAGTYQANTPPSEPAHAVFIGYVARSHPNLGRVVLAIQNGYELNELHGVLVPSPSNNDVLYYDGGTSLWKNKALSKSDVGLSNVDNTSDVNKQISTATQTALNSKQDSLVSGTNIKTINSTSLLGSGDVAVQPSLVSGTNIKTINSTTILGSGDIAVQSTLVSGSNIKTINSTSVLGSGNISLPAQDSISLINNTAVTIGASTTSYISFCAFTTNSVETSRQIIVPISGTIKNLYVLTSTTQSSAGSQVCTLRKNGVNTAITTTIGANAVAGTFSDTTNSVSVSAGDKLSLQVQNNAGTGTASTIVSVAIIIERT